MKNRKTWNDCELERELRQIVEGIGEMPSHTFLKEIGRGDIANQITKRGGSFHWAAKLGTIRRFSDSDMGWKAEKESKEILERHGFSVERMPGVTAPYDLLIDKCVRVDVKSANYAEYGACKGWFYRIGKYVPADILALFQMDSQDFYFIPWNFAPTTNITISVSGGKYARFKNRFDLISSLIIARADERKIWSEFSDRNGK